MKKTPELAALHDDERFTQITNMLATVLSHYVAKSFNVHLTLQCCVHPENMNPFNPNVWAVDHADEGQAFFCLGDQINVSEKWWSRMPAFCYCLASEASSRRRIHSNLRPE